MTKRSRIWSQCKFEKFKRE